MFGEEVVRGLEADALHMQVWGSEGGGEETQRALKRWPEKNEGRGNVGRRAESGACRGGREIPEDLGT